MIDDDDVCPLLGHPNREPATGRAELEHTAPGQVDAPDVLAFVVDEVPRTSHEAAVGQQRRMVEVTVLQSDVSPACGDLTLEIRIELPEVTRRRVLRPHRRAAPGPALRAGSGGVRVGVPTCAAAGRRAPVGMTAGAAAGRPAPAWPVPTVVGPTVAVRGRSLAADGDRCGLRSIHRPPRRRVLRSVCQEGFFPSACESGGAPSKLTILGCKTS